VYEPLKSETVMSMYGVTENLIVDLEMQYEAVSSTYLLTCSYWWRYIKDPGQGNTGFDGFDDI